MVPLKYGFWLLLFFHRLYLLYNHWGFQILVYAFILVDLALAIFEDPAVVPLPIWVDIHNDIPLNLVQFSVLLNANVLVQR